MGENNKKAYGQTKSGGMFWRFFEIEIRKAESIRYSLHVAANVRLIIEPNAEQDTVMICTEIEVEGVSDYHGSKENWYIP